MCGIFGSVSNELVNKSKLIEFYHVFGIFHLILELENHLLVTITSQGGLIDAVLHLPNC